MKKTILMFLVLTAFSAGMANETPATTDIPSSLNLKSPISLGWEKSSPRKISEDDPILEAFSPKALELIKEYSPRRNPIISPSPRFNLLYPLSTDILKKHLSDEYRPAWEELFKEYILDGENVKMIGVRYQTVSSILPMVGGTNSVPFLIDVFGQLLDMGPNENIGRQMEILLVLTKINNPESLRTAFLLLVFTEKEYGPVLRESFLNKVADSKLSAEGEVFLEKVRKLNIADWINQNPNKEKQ